MGKCIQREIDLLQKQYTFILHRVIKKYNLSYCSIVTFFCFIAVVIVYHGLLQYSRVSISMADDFLCMGRFLGLTGLAAGGFLGLTGPLAPRVVVSPCGR